MKTIIEHLTPFTERIPPENTDLFVCEEKDNGRRYGIMRFFKKGTLMPRSCSNEAKTIEEWLLKQIFNEPCEGEYAPATAFYRFVKNRKHDEKPGVWIKSSINPLDASYIIINPEELK